MLSSYAGTRLDLYKRYMDAVAGAGSCSEEDLRRFLVFASSFHRNLDYTWSVSTDKLPFLEIHVKPLLYLLKTQIATPTSPSAHPIHPAASHPYLMSVSYRLRTICSENDDFDIEATKMETFFCSTRLSE